MYGNGNGSNGLYPIENKVCEKQETYRSELGKPLSEWLEEQTKETPYDPSTGYGYAKYDRDIVELGALMEPKVSPKKVLIIQHLSDLYYRKKRVGSTQETLARIARVGPRQVNTLMQELLQDELECPFPNCLYRSKILEINEKYVRGREGSSYFLPYRDFLAHIRKEHFEKMKVLEFNSFVGEYINSLTSEGVKTNMKKVRKETDPWKGMVKFKK